MITFQGSFSPMTTFSSSKSVTQVDSNSLQSMIGQFLTSSNLKKLEAEMDFLAILE